jgi:hypothetical protein
LLLRRTSNVAILVPLLGSAILVALAWASLPWSEGLFERPRTPFTRSAARSVEVGYALLTAAQGVIPVGASVVARTEPPDASRESDYHRFLIALLPGRRALPSASYGTFLPHEVWQAAEYVVIVGPRPAVPPGDLLLETPDGTIWKRRR